MTAYQEFLATKMSIAITKMSREDASSLAKIDEVVFGGSCQESDFLGYIDSEIYCFFVAKIDEKAVLLIWADHMTEPEGFEPQSLCA